MSETHEIVVLKPKPSDLEIHDLVKAYFDSEAKTYNEFSAQSEKRRGYLSAVDLIIAADLSSKTVANLLSIGCGTGARELRIRELSAKSFEVFGVDVSPEMCKEAQKLGIGTVAAPWLAADIEGKCFDAVVYLHSFGLCPSAIAREKEIQKIAHHLKPGGSLYVDVLSLDDKNEWGPSIEKIFTEQKLSQFGYDQGDVLYRRIDGSNLSFFHYFRDSEMRDLFEKAGLVVQEIHHLGYGANYGAAVAPGEGAMLYVVSKA